MVIYDCSTQPGSYPEKLVPDFWLLGKKNRIGGREEEKRHEKGETQLTCSPYPE